MAEVKLTKNELRAQQIRLAQLEKYLPTLQLKKAMLQAQVQEARHEIEQALVMQNTQKEKIEHFSALFSEQGTVDFQAAAKVEKVNKRFENIAGVEVPYLQDVIFAAYDYNLYDTPAWVDAAITSLRKLTEAKIRVDVAQEKKNALEEELRQVSIRVNLFEKILIPRAQKNIKKIRIFLGDQQLAAVSQAKVAKNKIMARKEQHLSQVITVQEDTHAQRRN